MPAYNAEKTLEKTYHDVPPDSVDDIILVDDASRDRTVEIAHRLGIHVVVHPRNRGYGANQKTCYRTALERGRTSSSWCTPTTSTTPGSSPTSSRPCAGPSADAVFGSRMLGGQPIQGGMPKWKYLGNILLTAIENATFLIYLTEYHSGFRAYTRRYLETVDFEANSDGFVFDTEIIAQGMAHRLTHPRDPDRDPLLRRGVADRLRSLGPVRARDPEDDGAVQAPRVGRLVQPDLPEEVAERLSPPAPGARRGVRPSGPPPGFAARFSRAERTPSAPRAAGRG